jgi:opacity protein-like surface antigen
VLVSNNSTSTGLLEKDSSRAAVCSRQEHGYVESVPAKRIWRDFVLHLIPHLVETGTFSTKCATKALDSAFWDKPYIPLVFRVAAVCFALVFGSAPLIAGQSDGFRPYLHFRSAEFNTAWGVNDGWGFGLGTDINRYFGAELAVDFYELDLEDHRFGVVGEMGAWNIVPQLRFRYPLGRGRWVPYFLAGGGVSFLQFNDPKPAAFGQVIDADGTRPVLAVGVGLEYFLADNVTFNLENKYLWVQRQDAMIAGERRRLDMSAPLLTMGVRAYFRETEPRLLAEQEDATPTRLYAGARFGGSVLTERQWAPGVRLEPEANALSSVNHYGGLALGANFGNHWGIEFAGEMTEFNLWLADHGAVGEYSVYTIVPHARFRYPLRQGRVVPYLLAGIGATYAEFNDRKPAGEHLRIAAKGVNPAISVGGGVEYFMARNFSINSDVRWLHTWNHQLRVNGRTSKGDFSTLNFFVGFRLYLLEI